MKRFKNSLASFFQEVWKCVTDFSFYTTVAQRPLPSALRYYAKLVAFYIIIITLLVIPGIIIGFQTIGNWMIANFPPATVTNGEIHFTGISEPYERAEGKEFKFLIDTKNAQVALDPAYMHSVVIKKDRILIKSGQFMKEYTFPPNRTFDINDKTITTFKNIFIVFGILAAFVLNAVAFTVTKTIQSLFFAGIVLLFLRIKDIQVAFVSVWKIALYALTAPVLLSMIVLLLGLHFSLSWVIYTAFYLVFLLGAMNTVIKSAHEEPSEEEERDS